jgi:precorrin-3B synthase
MRVGESFCPGILHAIEAKDGLLIRMRVPGGMIVPSQLLAIAELSAAFSDGNVEITSRSNLQMRAIEGKNLNLLTRGLESAGFLPSRQHDRIRNVVTSPFAGLGFDEILDSRPFVRELDHRINRDQLMAGLPPKFSFAIDGGGSWFSRESDDLALQVVSVDNCHLFHLAIGGASSGFGVKIESAIDCLLEASRICLHISRKFDVTARGRSIASMPQMMNYFLHELSDFLVTCPCPEGSKFFGDMPVGVYLTKQTGFVNLVPSVPLGRLTSGQTQCVASIAKEWGGDLRLAPWRGIVIGSSPQCAHSEVASRLKAEGLLLDGKDGYRGVFACAGSTGCDASFADVRSDASFLARHLSGRHGKPGWRVNISGCEKQCAMRNGATAELIANSSGYDLRIDGHFVTFNCSREFAIEAVARRSKVHSEVFSR